MADITKCVGFKNEIDCPNRSLCYRYTAKASEPHQSYFQEAPFKEDFISFCEYFWEDPKQFSEAIKEPKKKKYLSK